MSTEQIVKLSFSIRLATNFLQYLLDFSYFLCHEIVPRSSVINKFTKNKVVEIYIYVFTKGLPSKDECHLKRITEIAPPLLPLAKESTLHELSAANTYF